MQAKITYKASGNTMQAEFNGPQADVFEAIRALDENCMNLFIEAYDFTFDNGHHAGNSGRNASAYMYEVIESVS